MPPSGTAATSVSDVTGHPRISFTDADGTRRTIDCRYLVGADGSRSICRQQIPAQHRRRYLREYPFAWLGILCRAPISSPELIYARSDRGFALISQRTEDVQRMYLQCDPGTDVDDWSDDRIWSELQSRLAGSDGFELQEGPVIQKTLLAFRSFVQEPMRYGNLVLAGDAAHTVPPTGAKGLNLALADVRVLAETLTSAVRSGNDLALDEYTQRALARVWKAQHFSYWMTTMLHTPAGSDAFDTRRQLGELETLTTSEAGARYLAEGYTGWPTP
jgi:p-hydroxybenzoate 3-monooxygenase